jgi:hypothetical protein
MDTDFKAALGVRESNNDTAATADVDSALQSMDKSAVQVYSVSIERRSMLSTGARRRMKGRLPGADN